MLLGACLFQFGDQKTETQTGRVTSVLSHSRSVASPNSKQICLAPGPYANCVIKVTRVDLGLNIVSTTDQLSWWLGTSYLVSFVTHFLLHEMGIMTSASSGLLGTTTVHVELQYGGRVVTVPCLHSWTVPPTAGETLGS